MDSDERQIYDYLKSWPKQYVSAREICLRAGGKRRYREDNRWALPVITRLLEDNLIETDSLGHYRVKPPKIRGERQKSKRWISPQIAKILRQSGKEFDGVGAIDLEAPDEP